MCLGHSNVNLQMYDSDREHWVPGKVSLFRFRSPEASGGPSVGSLREHLVPRIQGQSGREQAVLMKCESMAVSCLWLCVDGRLWERACGHLEAMGPRGPHMAASCLCLSLSLPSTFSQGYRAICWLAWELEANGIFSALLGLLRSDSQSCFESMSTVIRLRIRLSLSDAAFQALAN